MILVIVSQDYFFDETIDIDILEQFAFLKTQEGGKIALDILQTSTKVLAQ